MQLTRNTYNLGGEKRTKSLNRKFLEIALTYRVESTYTKSEILTHYLNRIYFGSGCNGIEEAALTYFGRTTAQLSPAQSALLAGIIRAPHAASPHRNLPRAIQEQHQVLERLITTNQLTPQQAKEIKKTPIQLRDPTAGTTESNHAERALRRPLETILSNNQITTGGLTVHTSLDQKLQSQLELLLQQTHLPDNLQTASIAIHPSTGDILAIIGTKDPKPSAFNRALDSARDLGPNLMEPLLATIAIERGHLPIPGNPVTTGRQLHPKDAIQLLRRFGFENNFGQGEDLYRGALTTTPLELATAYATIFNQGNRPSPVYIRQLDHGEKTIFNRQTSTHPSFSQHSRPEHLPTSINGPSLPKTDHWFATLHDQQIIILWIGHDTPKSFTLPNPTIQSLTHQLKKLTPE